MVENWKKSKIKLRKLIDIHFPFIRINIRTHIQLNNDIMSSYGQNSTDNPQLTRLACAVEVLCAVVADSEYNKSASFIRCCNYLWERALSVYKLIACVFYTWPLSGCDAVECLKSCMIYLFDFVLTFLFVCFYVRVFDPNICCDDFNSSW